MLLAPVRSNRPQWRGYFICWRWLLGGARYWCFWKRILLCYLSWYLASDLSLSKPISTAFNIKEPTPDVYLGLYNHTLETIFKVNFAQIRDEIYYVTNGVVDILGIKGNFLIQTFIAEAFFNVYIFFSGGDYYIFLLN